MVKYIHFLIYQLVHLHHLQITFYVDYDSYLMTNTVY